jgi:hypothetical protein
VQLLEYDGISGGQVKGLLEEGRGFFVEEVEHREGSLVDEKRKNVLRILLY